MKKSDTTSGATKARRLRFDSVAGEGARLRAAELDYQQPPVHVALAMGALPFWHSLIRARARGAWADHELVLLAQLARTQHDIEIEQKLVNEEGSTIVNDRGTVITNPRFGALCRLKEQQLSTIKALSLHSFAGQDKRDVAKRSTAGKAADAALDKMMDSEEDLIPR